MLGEAESEPELQCVAVSVADSDELALIDGVKEGDCEPSWEIDPEVVADFEATDCVVVSVDVTEAHIEGDRVPDSVADTVVVAEELLANDAEYETVAVPEPGVG